MKSLILAAFIALSTQSTLAQDFQKFGSSGLVKLGRGSFQLVIKGEAAQKVFNDMKSLRSISGTKTGNDIVCENDLGAFGEKQCSIIILNSKTGSLGNPSSMNSTVKMKGRALSYHSRTSSTFSVLTITGAMGSAAQILWSNLDRAGRTGLGNQKAGERYTCDRFQLAPIKVEFRCEFMMEDRTQGTIGMGGAG